MYPTKYMGKTTDMYVCEIEILAATKPTILSQNLCCKQRKQNRVIDTSFRLHGKLQAENTQWHFYGIHGMS